MYRFLFTPKAEKDLKNIPKVIAKQIAKKLIYFSNEEDPFKFAKKLKNPLSGWRFRVGNYRIIFEVDKNKNVNILMILRIAHRKDIYKA